MDNVLPVCQDQPRWELGLVVCIYSFLMFFFFTIDFQNEHLKRKIYNSVWLPWKERFCLFIRNEMALSKGNTLLINHFQSGSRLWVLLRKARQQVVQTRQVFEQHLLLSLPKAQHTPAPVCAIDECTSDKARTRPSTVLYTVINDHLCVKWVRWEGHPLTRQKMKWLLLDSIDLSG